MTSIWLSTPLRLSIAIVALFALVSMASFAATYAFVRDQAEQQIRTALAQEMSGYKAIPTQRALVTLVRSQSSAMSPNDRILSYALPGGLHVGNAALISNGEGFRAISFDEDIGAIEGDYFALAQWVKGGLLTLATNADPIKEVRETFLNVLLFTLIPTCLIALGGGFFLARRSERRIGRIETALDALTQGDLTARVSGMGGRADDLSRIGARIDRMAEAQERQMSALKQVSSDIAHDLKTPIQRVSVLLEKLQARPDLTDEAGVLASDASRETRDIVRTFHALLQIAQIEGGSPKARFGPVDLRKLAETFCEVYEPSAEDSGHTIKCTVPDDPVIALGDRTLLGQALANLIENALRHTPASSDIVIAAGTDPDGVWLEVADTGPGIPEDERENVLRRLYRLESSRTTPGSGLGLSLVAAIADIHDGSLDLEDNAPGLRARLRVPRAS